MEIPNLQKGFSVVVFVILIALLSSGIIGGSLLIKKNYPQLINNASTNVDSSKPTSSKSDSLPQTKESRPVESNIQNSTQPVTFQNKVIFARSPFSKGNINVGIASSDGKNITQFSSQIPQDNKMFTSILVSPNYAKLIIGLTDKSSFNSNNPFPDSEYYFSSIDGKQVSKLDVNKLKKDLGNVQYLTVDGWSIDSKKALITAYESVPIVNGSNVSTSNISVYEYDIDTSNTTKLFSKSSTLLGEYYYDSSKKIIVYVDNWGSSLDSKRLLRNLTNGSETEIKTPNMFNHNNLNGFSWGQYYGGGFNPQASLKEMRNFKIYSLDNITTPISEVSLTDPENAYFNYDIYWSPNYNYFAAIIKFNGSGSLAKSYKQPILNIYSRDGKLVSTVELNDTVFLSNSVASYSVYQRLIFSSDEKSLLIASNHDYKPGEIYWRVIDVKTGSVKVPKFTNPDLGIPIVWY